MPNVLVRGLNDDVLKQLKAAAKASGRSLQAEIHDVLRRANGRPGHVFNLGHGVLPGTPLERVQELARYVHRTSARPVDQAVPLSR